MTKLFPLRSTIFLVLLAFALSCTDHDIPEKIELKTLPISSNPNGLKCSIVFALNVVKTGSLPVKEYGVVYSSFGAGNGPVVENPTIENNLKVIFDLPATVGDKSKIGPQLCTNNINYRAYAILIDDSVVYGDMLNFHDN
jgi:hypothetical protein